MSAVTTGLDRIVSEKELQAKFKGRIGYLCHSASVTKDLEHGLLALQRVFGQQASSMLLLIRLVQPSLLTLPLLLSQGMPM